MAITISGTTGIAGVDGSAGTPAVQGTDTNTGVFYPAADTVGVSTGGSERMRVDSSGNVGIGTSSPACVLDVVGGIQTSRTAVTSPAATDGNIFSGTYTPTLSNTTNVASSTSAICQYMRVGNVVTVSGEIVIVPTAGTTTATYLGISLPVASNLAATRQLAGTAVDSFNLNTPGRIRGVSATDVAQLEFYAKETTSRTWSFQFTYLVV